METPTLQMTLRPPVRWPFRILAGLIAFCGVVAIAGLAFASWHGDAGSVRWKMLVALPGMAALIRLAWVACVHGRAPTTECWPFASQKIFMVYILLLLLSSSG